MRFQENWRLALTLLRQVRAAGIGVTAVLADAECGDNSTLRDALHRADLAYAVGVSATLTVFPDACPCAPSRHAARPPAITAHVARRRRAPRPPGARGVVAGAAVADDPVAQCARRPGVARQARVAAARVTPAHAWRQRRLPPDVWWLAEQDRGATPRIKCYLVHLPATASLRALVQLAHQRWAIEQQYQELKDDLGLDHFEGRSLPGWERHVALAALAYTFLQVERQRPTSRSLTLPHVRAIIREVLTAHFFVTRPQYLKRMLKLQDVVLRT